VIRRGEIYLYDGDPVVGNEQGGRRPGVVVSGDPFNDIAGRHIVLVVPVTRRIRGWPTHVLVKSGTGGLEVDSYAMTEQLRAISPRRLARRLGSVDAATMSSITGALRGILALD
jgi:mRNA interferase MazF